MRTIAAKWCLLMTIRREFFISPTNFSPAACIILGLAARETAYKMLADNMRSMRLIGFRKTGQPVMETAERIYQSRRVKEIN